MPARPRSPSWCCKAWANTTTCRWSEGRWSDRSADRRLVLADELTAQLALQDLARGVARQHVDESHRLRHLELGELAQAVADDVAFLESLAGLPDDDRHADFAPALVGHTDD